MAPPRRGYRRINGWGKTHGKDTNLASRIAIATALERLASLALAEKRDAAELAAEVLALVAECVEADAVFVGHLDGISVRVEQVHDRVGLGLRAGDTLTLQDQHFRALVDVAGEDGPPEDVYFESLVLGLKGGLRACTSVPLGHHPKGGPRGAPAEDRLGVIHPESHHADSAELALLRLSGRMVVQTVEILELREQVMWKHQALHDPLTGLPNRILLQDRLEQGIAVAVRGPRPLAVLLIDLDGFKAVNDTFGHRVGDELLRRLGPRLRRLLRESDTIARLGGDEFVVLLPGVSAPDATLVARKVLRSLRQPFLVGEHSIRIWASIGIALCPAHGRDAATLLDHADAAMYVCKHREGGYQLYRPPTAGSDQPADHPEGPRSQSSGWPRSSKQA